MPPSTILFVIMNKIHCENLEKNGRKDKRVQTKNRRYCYDYGLIIPSSGQSMLLVTQNHLPNAKAQSGNGSPLTEGFSYVTDLNTAAN